MPFNTVHICEIYHAREATSIIDNTNYIEIQHAGLKHHYFTNKITSKLGNLQSKRIEGQFSH